MSFVKINCISFFCLSVINIAAMENTRTCKCEKFTAYIFKRWVVINDSKSGEKIRTIDCINPYSITFSPDCKLLAVADKDYQEDRLYVLSTRNNEIIVYRNYLYPIKSMLFSANSKKLAIVFNDTTNAQQPRGLVSVIEIKANNDVNFECPKPFKGIEFSADSLDIKTVDENENILCTPINA